MKKLAEYTHDVLLNDRQKDGLDYAPNVSQFNPVLTKRSAAKLIDEKVLAVTTYSTVPANSPAISIPAFSLVSIDFDDKIVLSDQSDVSKMPVFGIINQNTIPGADVNIISRGYVENPLWSFTPKTALFAGLNGAILITPPTNGYLQKIGIALTSTKVYIEIGPLIFRG